MNHKRIELMWKILIVSGWVMAALLFIFPIVYGIIAEDDTEGLMIGTNIILGLVIIHGLLIGFLMIVGGSLLTKSKAKKSEIPCCDLYKMVDDLQSNLFSFGYTLVKTNENIGDFWIYKKHYNYFIVIDLELNNNCNKINSLNDVWNLIGLKDCRYATIVFCCNGLNSKVRNLLLNLSKERFNSSYLTAIVDFQNTNVTYRQLTDGYARKRQHKNIENLLFCLSTK